MLEREEGDVNVRFQLMGALKFDPASNTLRFARCQQFTLAFTRKHPGCQVGMTALAGSHRGLERINVCGAFVICEARCIIRNHFKL